MLPGSPKHKICWILVRSFVAVFCRPTCFVFRRRAILIRKTTRAFAPVSREGLWVCGLSDDWMPRLAPRMIFAFGLHNLTSIDYGDTNANFSAVGWTPYVSYISRCQKGQPHIIFLSYPLASRSLYPRSINSHALVSFTKPSNMFESAPSDAGMRKKCR